MTLEIWTGIKQRRYASLQTTILPKTKCKNATFPL